MSNWTALIRRADHVQIARLLIASDQRIHPAQLRAQPQAAVRAILGLTVIEHGTLPQGCGGGGYYDSSTRTIYLNPSGNRRDNFTVLHELGHLIQDDHIEWQLAVLALHPDEQRTLSEEVADAIAATLLLGGDPADDETPWHLSPAAVMADLHARSLASRSAIVKHAAATIPNEQRWILAAADRQGAVVCAFTTFDVPTPARGFTQPGFAALADEGEAQPLVRRRFTEGLRYRTGTQLNDLYAHAALDASSAYAFIALTPVHQFAMPTLSNTEEQCANPTCHVDYFSVRTAPMCTRCDSHRCPTCQACQCPSPRTGEICPQCFVAISPHEAANGTHDCIVG